MTERTRIRKMFRLSLIVAALLALALVPAIERGAAPGAGTAAAQASGAVEASGETHEATHEATPEAIPEATDAATHEASHGEAAAHEEGAPELDNIFNMLGFPHGVLWLHGFVGPDQIFMLFYIVVLITIAAVASTAMRDIPGPFQNGVEYVVEALDDFVVSVLGEHGRRFVPFLGTLFVYILLMNYSGMIPFLKAPTSNLSTTLALAICVFLYVQATGIRSLGLLGYVDHLAGSPRDVVGFVMVPLIMPLHILGELIKPFSLSVRLFGNVTGEDVLLAVFVGLGVSLYGALHLPLSNWVGLPLQAIVYPLLLIFGFIQALVFTLLSTVYFYMMLPHEEHR